MFINPGEMKDKIIILTLNSTSVDSQTSFAWNSGISVWSKTESLEKRNFFSSVGMGVKSIKFSMRKCNLSLHNALLWGERHCFITNIVEIDRKYFEVTVALIEPKQCSVTRTKVTKNELNRPVLCPDSTITFPGYLVEKYLGYKQETPHAVNETMYVLVTPKAIELEAGDLVNIDEETYNVRVLHTLDEFKNEYEIALKKDV